MFSLLIRQYSRTLSVMLILVVVLMVEALGVRESIYPGLLPFFQWMRHSFWFGVLGTTYGSLYATVQAVHLLSMAAIGGAILVTDLRLLNLALRDIPSEHLSSGTYKLFKVALIVAVVTGIFCAAGVADKVYYMQVFWIKMLVLVLGSCFMIWIKQPLLNGTPHNEINPWLLRLLAITSLLIWFTVAATGRWIGFS